MKYAHKRMAVMAHGNMHGYSHFIIITSISQSQPSTLMTLFKERKKTKPICLFWQNNDMVIKSKLFADQRRQCMKKYATRWRWKKILRIATEFPSNQLNRHESFLKSFASRLTTLQNWCICFPSQKKLNGEKEEGGIKHSFFKMNDSVQSVDFAFCIFNA